MIHIGIKRWALAMALSASVMSLAAASASASAVIRGVSFSGSSSSPSITVTGTGFGAHPPPAYSAARTSCGNYGTGNGHWYGPFYGNSLAFLDGTNEWNAGIGNTTSGGDCIGEFVDSWSSTQAVFHFGVAYGSYHSPYGPWLANPGDSYVINLKGSFWGGVVSYSTADTALIRTSSRHRNHHRG